MSSNPRTATFLFTDLENSTPLWENHPTLMQSLAARHDAVMRKAIEAHRGRVVKTTGDGFHAVFDTATDGIAAALTGQRELIAENWPAETGPLCVRMGLHTGESREREGDYYGSEVNRAARVMGIAYGGQVLISEVTAALIRNSLPPEVALSDLGRHRLKGLAVAEQIFQVQHPALPSDFPPLKSLSVYKHNLPVQLSTFVGREKELSDVERLLKENHLLTLLGPGGTGNRVRFSGWDAWPMAPSGLVQRSFATSTKTSTNTKAPTASGYRVLFLAPFQRPIGEDSCDSCGNCRARNGRTGELVTQSHSRLEVTHLPTSFLGHGGEVRVRIDDHRMAHRLEHGEVSDRVRIGVTA